MAEFTTLIDGLSFTECPRWRDGRLYLSDFYTHRVLAVALDGAVETIAEIRAIFDGGSTECDIVASFPRGPEQFAGCAMAGAHGVIVTTDVLRSMLVHPLTDRGIDQFLHDLSRRPKVRIS